MRGCGANHRRRAAAAGWYPTRRRARPSVSTAEASGHLKQGLWPLLVDDHRSVDEQTISSRPAKAAR
jgi:hypothetical protein